jgi:hypothetical protein
VLTIQFCGYAPKAIDIVLAYSVLCLPQLFYNVRSLLFEIRDVYGKTQLQKTAKVFCSAILY